MQSRISWPGRFPVVQLAAPRNTSLLEGPVTLTLSWTSRFTGTDLTANVTVSASGEWRAARPGWPQREPLLCR